MTRSGREIRIKAHKHLLELKKRGISRREVIRKIMKDFGVSKDILDSWYTYKRSPLRIRKRIENLEYNKDLFYILGALLGDGCIYYWGCVYQVKIYGEEEFAKKCAKKLSVCLKKNINYYFYKSYYKRYGTNLWYIQTDHKKLFNLFKHIRKNLDRLLNMMKRGDYRENSLQFIEGFFDAEGCIKIIKEPVRKIPKICPDICCTDYDYLELCRKLLDEHLNIEARYSIQKPKKTWKSHNKKTVYHLRIYRKEYVRKFLDSINTTKLSSEKVQYVKNWLNNKDKKEIITL